MSRIGLFSVVALFLAGAGCVESSRYIEMRSKYEEEAARNRQLIEDNNRLESEVGRYKIIATGKGIDADALAKELDVWKGAGMWGKPTAEGLELVGGGHLMRMTALTFASGSADLTPRGRAALDEIAAQLRAKAGVQLVVEGHTDNDPIRHSSNKSNWELSGKRAAAVVDYLVKAGVVKGENAMLVGYGEFRPIDPADKAKNRRVELRYLQLDKAGEPMSVPTGGVETPNYPRPIRPVNEGLTK